MHYAVRLTEPGRVRVFLKLKAGNLLAAIPGSEITSILEMISDVYGSMEPAKSVLQTSLQNANPIIHPAVTLANAARIEGTGGDFLFYEEGVTDSTGRLIEALDSYHTVWFELHEDLLATLGLDRTADQRPILLEYSLPFLDQMIAIVTFPRLNSGRMSSYTYAPRMPE